MRKLITTLALLFAAATLPAQTAPVVLGPYQYDGSGNVRAIGTEQFQYDRDARLVRAAMVPGTQTFTYLTYAVNKGGLHYSITWKANFGYVTTDDGHRVPASKATSRDLMITVTDSNGNLVQSGNLANAADPCHGATFAKGEVWIEPQYVPDILKGDGYTRTSTPGVGAVGIYTKDGQIVHSATVTAVDDKGKPSQVYSKSGLDLPKKTTPGPGPDTAWNDAEAKLEFYEQKKEH